jgi:hypothetical protein
MQEACAAVEKLPTLKRADCRQRAEKMFSSQVITSRYEDLYRLMMQENKKMLKTFKDGNYE